MDDVTQKVLVGVVTAVTITLIYKASKRYLLPVGELLLSLPSVVADIRFIKSELVTNGGRSLKDNISEISDMMTVLEARQRGLIAALPRAVFETDGAFNWTDGNLAMERLTGLGFAHLRRRRWFSMIHEDEREEVRNEIEHAVRDKRGVQVSFRFVTDNAEIPVRIEALPIFSRVNPDTVICWSGTMTKLDDRRVEERRSI